jgi:hypothetical protein
VVGGENLFPPVSGYYIPLSLKIKTINLKI